MIDFLQRTISGYVDEQYRRPSGSVGRLIGKRMASQHPPENEWAVSFFVTFASSLPYESFGNAIRNESKEMKVVFDRLECRLCASLEG